MKQERRADSAEAGPTEEGEQVESWLREAVHAPHAARLPSPGDIVGGKYRIEELLGRGGMGAVFRARHTFSEKTVAIKWMLRPASDEQARRRFEREARAAGRIDHPNVVGPYDIGEEGDCSYLVMELLRGESLRARLARGPLDPGSAVQMLIPAMRGVAAAHRAGVVHRDLKPDNIFLCEEPEGGPCQAKVLDFGVSGILGPERVDSTLTQEGTLLGSLAYMSPEQLSNPHDVDARADVYAFGVILYEVLTSTLPFRGASYSAVAIAIATSQPEPPSRKRPEIPLGLEQIVLRALARDRAERHPDMNALIEALLPFCPAAAERRSSGAVLESSSSRAGLSVTPDADAGPALRDRRILGASGSRIALVAAALVAVAAVWTFAARLRPEPDNAAARRQSPPGSQVATPVVTPGEPEQPKEPERVVPEQAKLRAPSPTAAPAPTPSTAGAHSEKPARPRTARPASSAHASSRASKDLGEARESVLFSGRK